MQCHPVTDDAERVKSSVGYREPLTWCEAGSGSPFTHTRWRTAGYLK